MGLYYAYRPKASFLGKLWWQLDGDFIHPLEWPDAEHKLEPVWVRFESGDGEDGYLRTESSEGSLEPWSPLKTKGVGSLHDVFWFAAYQYDGRFYYQIRPIEGDVLGTPALLPWVLKTDLVGYMGMYHTWIDPIEWVIYLGGDLWQFKGLDPAGLTTGERYSNLRMSDSSDNPVTRYLQFKRPYLRTGARGKGRITVEVLRAGYSP